METRETKAQPKKSMPRTPLCKFLAKEYEKKNAEAFACKESDKKTSMGMVNNNPSEKTVKAVSEAYLALKAYQKELNNPTVTNPC